MQFDALLYWCQVDFTTPEVSTILSQTGAAVLSSCIVDEELVSHLGGCHGNWMQELGLLHRPPSAEDLLRYRGGVGGWVDSAATREETILQEETVNLRSGRARKEVEASFAS